jgi:hypothetical protein
MRIKTIVGVAFAGAAAAAVVAGGVAYASTGDGSGGEQLRIVQDDGSGTTGGAAYDGRDCPEKGDGGQSEAPTTPSQPGTAPETAPETAPPADSETL